MRQQRRDWLRQTLAQLEKAANPADAVLFSRYFATDLRVLGIRAPVLQQMDKALRPQLAAVSGEELIAFGKALVGSQIFEARQLAYMMLHSQPRALEVMNLDDLEVLGTGMDNWASVDTFSTLLAGVLWKNSKISDQAIQNWAGRMDVWWRRAALVSTIPLNLKSKGGKGDLPRTLDICDRLKGDPHRMVQKAISWALRELSKRYPEEVGEFLAENKPVMTKSTVNEVSKKLEAFSKK